MGLDVKTLLCEYFSKEEVQDALRDIGKSTTGTKEELVEELSKNWESFNREKYELLDFADEATLQQICYYYNLDATPTDHGVLKRRIKKADLLGRSGKPKPTAHVSNPSSMVDDSRFYSEKPKIKAEEKSEPSHVHFHFSSIISSRRWLIGIGIAIASIVIPLIAVFLR